MSWEAARQVAYEAGSAAMPRPCLCPLAECDQATLAADLLATADIPAFPSAAVDGYAVRGPGPWRLTGRTLAGEGASSLTTDGEAVRIATGAVVPTGTEAILRTEDAISADGWVSGTPRGKREWRLPGEEARERECLARAGTAVTPAVVGLAAASGHDALVVRRRPRAAVLVMGTELDVSGRPAPGRIRDSLGPQLPSWLSRLGADVTTQAVGPVGDSPTAQIASLGRAVASGADIIVTTGGTMHGPADWLRTALDHFGARYLVDTVRVRPGSPMLLAVLAASAGANGTLVAGLPGNPLSAIAGLMTLVAPVLAGLAGREVCVPRQMEAGRRIPGHDSRTQLALVSLGRDGRVYPVRHDGSAMLRGLAASIGFAVVLPRSDVAAGTRVAVLPLPLFPGEQVLAAVLSVRRGYAGPHELDLGCAQSRRRDERARIRPLYHGRRVRPGAHPRGSQLVAMVGGVLQPRRPS